MRAPKTLILGLGRFGGGVAAARYLASKGHRLRIADRAGPDELRDSTEALRDVPRIEWCLGREDDFLLDGVDLLVCNPAVPPKHPLLRGAETRHVPVTQEINLVLENYPGRVVVVTGTNGKSTTATLLAAALRRSGIDTLLGGNIGRSLLSDVENWREHQVAVLEISSFQLERIDPEKHRVAGAVFTRLGEDHIDRHRTLAAYHAAKGRAAAMADDFVAFQVDDPVAAAMTHRASETLRYGTPQNGDPVEVSIEGGIVWSTMSRNPGPILSRAALSLPGGFQVLNAAAASTAALRMGGDRHHTGFAIATTQPLPHRLQLTASIGGVRIFDNGVSTQVDSTLSALDSLTGRVHWVGGGKSKDDRFNEPGRRLSERVCTAHLFGSAAPVLGPVMAGQVPTTVSEDLEQALEAAWAQSRTGDTILFSPAFASFDQFPNYTLRAARFAEWVQRLHERDDSRSTEYSGSASPITQADESTRSS